MCDVCQLTKDLTKDLLMCSTLESSERSCSFSSVTEGGCGKGVYSIIEVSIIASVCLQCALLLHTVNLSVSSLLLSTEPAFSFSTSLS